MEVGRRGAWRGGGGACCRRLLLAALPSPRCAMRGWAWGLCCPFSMAKATSAGVLVVRAASPSAWNQRRHLHPLLSLPLSMARARRVGCLHPKPTTKPADRLWPHHQMGALL